ncbi:hypothetical protein ACEQ8H_008796 [Pleosporales sp. CAS-2024a]
MASLKDNRTLRILDAAAAGKYGVMGAIAYNIEQLTALVAAAESARSPLILQLFPSTLQQVPLLAHAAAHAVKTASVPLSLHIDHAQDASHIRSIIDSVPVDSVMVDMSHHSEAENLALTRQLTLECHARGIAVEAESGRIQGGEDGIADTHGLEALFTTPQDVRRFLAAGIDMLAPSIGNVHGDYGPAGPREGQIHFDRLDAIAQQIAGRVHVALHGTNDFSPDMMRRCIQAGAVKLNVNKLLLQVGNDVLSKNAPAWGIPKLMDEQIKVIQRETVRWMEICGSAGKGVETKDEE